MDKSLLQKYLTDQIPISKALGIQVQSATCEKVILCAPLEPNINHKKTIFGGSLYSVATLACWSIVFLNVKRLSVPCEIVISQGDMQYLKPVSGDFAVICELERNQELLRFERILQKKNKARIQLKASIYQDSMLAVEYVGNFVALKQ